MIFFIRTIFCFTFDLFIHCFYRYLLGGVKSRQRFFSQDALTIKHIPRIGYVTLFPFLLNIIPLHSENIKYILDIIESPDHLWTNHGLRSISKVGHIWYFITYSFYLLHYSFFIWSLRSSSCLTITWCYTDQRMSSSHITHNYILGYISI